MAFRTVVVQNRCKLEYSLNYLICRKGNDVTRIVIDEIKTLVIDSLQVSITSGLINELLKKKVKILFIDEKHNPLGEMIPYQNNYYSFRKIKEQISVSKEKKDYLWKKIIEKKIINQANNLYIKNLRSEFDLLIDYSQNVELGDITNREGHSAKVYFNGLFGKDFSRDQDNNTNKFLNYGYSIILSSINRELKILGYLTELGIHHIGESNPFNLSCDLIEPIRPLVDSFVIENVVNDENYKLEFIAMLSKKVKYNDKEIFLENAIRLYVEDMMHYLIYGIEEKIKFINYEL